MFAPLHDATFPDKGRLNCICAKWTVEDACPYKDNGDLHGIKVGATTSPLADLASDFVATWSVRVGSNLI